MLPSLSFLLRTALILTCGSSAFAGSDLLSQQKLSIKSTQSAAVLEKTADNIKDIFERFKPGTDSSSKVTVPLNVDGTQDRPVVKVSIQRCVFIICKTVDLNAEVSIAPTSGSCDKNYLLTADLTRSSDLLSQMYDRLDVSICYQGASDGTGVLNLTAQAHQAPQYDAGLIQKQVFLMLQLQVNPIVQALNSALTANF